MFLAGKAYLNILLVGNSFKGCFFDSNMKLRQKPDDFIVEEIASKELKEKGKIAIYDVTKTNLTTPFAAKILARYLGLVSKNVKFAGLKDRHAKTRQYFSAGTTRAKAGNFREKNIISKLVGFSGEELKTGDLIGNKFKIVVRDVKKIFKNKDIEIPNYFDSQRFGSLKGSSDFIARDIIKNNYESALKKVLTATNRHQKSNLRDLKKFISPNWGNWKACLQKAENLKLRETIEEAILSHLIRTNNDYKGAFNLITKSLRDLYFSAYQSYIWNECVKLLVKENSSESFQVKYEAGRLLFPKTWKNKLKFDKLEMVSPDLKVDEEKMKIISMVLRREGLKLEDLRIEDYFFKAHEREILIKPKNFSISELENDEVNAGKKKVTISFELSKGSYATIILKFIFEE